MKKLYQVIFSLVVTVVLLYVVLSRIDVGNAIDVLLGMDLFWLALAFLGYLMTTFLKGLRWQLVARKFSVAQSFAISAIHQLFLNLLPFRLGEASILYMFKKKGIKVKNTLGFMLVLRLLDVISIMMLLFAGWVIVQESVVVNGVYVGVFVVALAGVFLLLFRNDFALGVLLWLLALFRLRDGRMGKRVVGAAKEVCNELNGLRSRVWLLLGVSLGNWIAGILSTWFVLLALGVDFSFARTIVGISLYVLLSVLPVQGIAGFGSYESFWTIGFVVAGMSEGTAIMTGLNTHLALLSMTIVLGLVFVFGWKNR